MTWHLVEDGRVFNRVTIGKGGGVRLALYYNVCRCPINLLSAEKP
jgi:hypothetical protein